MEPSLKPKLERFGAGRHIVMILICIIGPFILERSAPNTSFLLVLLVTALGCLCGFAIFHIKRRAVYYFIALGLYIAILDVLVNCVKHVGPVYLNWAGGFFAGFMIGMWPINSEAEAEERQKKEPVPGWHVNNQELGAVSMVADRALAAPRDLDGSTQYFLCVTYGQSRIDIVGHYQHGLVVLCTPDIHDSENWSILTGPSTNQQIVEFSAGPDHSKLPANNLVDAQLAQRALEYFIAYQKPTPTLAWFTGPKVYARRPRSTRVLSEKTWAKQDSSSAPATARPEATAHANQVRKDK